MGISAIPGYEFATAPWKESAGKPPPWPLAPDPRTEACTHDWDGSWGHPGERQHLCHYCQRWIWEHSIHTERNQQP